MTTEISFTCTCYKAADKWGTDAATNLLLAMREAGAGKDKTADMIWHLIGLKATEGAVVALAEQIIDGGAIPTKTEARLFVVGYAAKARREGQAQPAQIPAEPTLGAWMRHYDAFQAEQAAYGRCD